MRKHLHIEGTSVNDNGNLRKGFNKLFSKLLKGSMPRIIMGNGKSTTIDKFTNDDRADEKTLLIDLDDKPENKQKYVEKLPIISETSIYFMIQETEAWFLSQPNILKARFGVDLSKKIKTKPIQSIDNPSEFLKNLLSRTVKKEYHKVTDGAALLGMLDAEQLKNDFPEFKSLVERLES